MLYICIHIYIYIYIYIFICITKLKDKIFSYPFKPFLYISSVLVCLISSYSIVCYLDSKALIKNCPNILRAFKEPSIKKCFSCSILFPIYLMLSTSFMLLNTFL